MVPWLGGKLPAMMRTRVDLPAPLSPIRPTTSPGAIDRSTPCSARIAPNCLPRPLSSRTGCPAAALLIAVLPSSFIDAARRLLSLDIPVHHAFEIFLPARTRLRIQADIDRALGELSERAAAGENRLGLLAIPAGIACGERRGERPGLQHLVGRDQRAGAGVHRADMGMQQIVGIDRLPANLGVEVQ